MADQGQGWHDDSKEHAEAAKGKSPKSDSSNSSSQGQGWHNDSAEHSEAAKGKNPKSEDSILDNL
jgi:hypothetical protein